MTKIRCDYKMFSIKYNFLHASFIILAVYAFLLSATTFVSSRLSGRIN